MPTIAVINRKGGSGKSTLATHLAAYCSRQGLPVLLGDTDRNRSSQRWLELRGQVVLPPAGAKGALAPITGRGVDLRNVLRAPPGTAHVVLDTPGGLHGFELARVVCHADAVLMPVCPSMFDRETAAACWAELRALPRVASGRCRVAAVGMRVDARTKAHRLLKAWAQAQDLPFIASLRDAQTYVHGAESGLSLFDLPPLRVAADLAEWAPLLDWLQPVLHPAPPVAVAPLASSVRPCFKPAAAHTEPALAAGAADTVRDAPPVSTAPTVRGGAATGAAALPQAPPALAARSFFDRNPARLPGITIPGALDVLPPFVLPPLHQPKGDLLATRASAWARRLDRVLDTVSISRWLARPGARSG